LTSSQPHRLYTPYKFHPLALNAAEGADIVQTPTFATESTTLTSSPHDQHFMRETLALAAQAVGVSEPNPRVGCVILNKEGHVIGRGRTQEAGGPHAEVMALREGQASGADLRGTTVYVSLEPCAHHGRTPPCCDALVAAGVGRVVMALQDPNPLVAGQGAARLRAAGIEVVDWPEGPLLDEAHELNIGFLSRMQRGRPWVRLKMALSLDGRSALPDGRSQWITGDAARADGHAWRKRAGAVLTGIGTVLADNPRLDVRLVPTRLQPLRVVIDARLETPPDARVFEPSASVAAPALGPLIYTALLPQNTRQTTPQNAPHNHREQQRHDALQARGAEICVLPDAQHPGRVDLNALLLDLAQRGINELHLEAGHGLNGALVRAGMVDEFLIYLAPKLLGQGHGLASIGALAGLNHAPALRFTSVTLLEPDLRILARPVLSI
jgi:diaminohydroxyphosphoribosylaminopyrimidine deaminase / 5-amino-6-(5-phosphoribosylamino)uracil reductase